MKKIKRIKQLGFMTALVIAFWSCKGQETKAPVETKQQQPVATTPYKGTIFNESPGGIPNEDIVELFYDGQVCHWVRAITEDKNGNLWMGTNHYGLMRYDGKKLEYLGEEAGVGNDRINAIVVDKEGVVWIATAGGLTKYENETFTNYTTADGLADDGVYSMLLDSKDRLWLGTMQGVNYIEEGTIKSFVVPKPVVDKPSPSLSLNGISNIFEDNKGNYWFGFDGQGFSIYDGNEFSFLTTANGLQDNSAGGLYQDAKGDYWIASMNGGMSRYDGSSFTHFTQTGQIAGVETTGVYQDSRGDLWFGVEHVGVYRYDGNSFELFNEEDGLLSQGIIAIYEDSKGRFWMGGWKGLFRFDRQAHKNGEKSFVAVTQTNGPWN